MQISMNIPCILSHSFIVQRLLVNLTNPALLLYNEDLPTDPSGRRCYLQIISQLQVYKEAFADESLWAVLAKKLTKILQIVSIIIMNIQNGSFLSATDMQGMVLFHCVRTMEEKCSF